MDHLPQVLLLIGGIVVAAKLAGAISVRYGQPAVLGEIAIGLVLGPTVLDVLDLGVFSQASPHTTGAVDALIDAAQESESLVALGETANSLYLEALIKDLAEIGVILLMFVAGMETDLEEMKKVGKTAFWAAMGGILLPLLGGPFSAITSDILFTGKPFLWERFSPQLLFPSPPRLSSN